VLQRLLAARALMPAILAMALVLAIVLLFPIGAAAHAQL
jgi:hypothetical protein